MNIKKRHCQLFSAALILSFIQGCKFSSLFDKPIATVDGKSVYQSEYQEFLDQTPPESIAHLKTEKEKIAFILRTNAIEIMARQKNLHKIPENKNRLVEAQKAELTNIFWDELIKEKTFTITQEEIDEELATNRKEFSEKRVYTYLVKEFKTKEQAVQFAKKAISPLALKNSGSTEGMLTFYLNTPEKNGPDVGLVNLLKSNTLKVAPCKSNFCYYMKTNEYTTPARDAEFSRKFSEQRVLKRKRNEWLHKIYQEIQIKQ